jgi:triacylglycerol lipase
MQFLTSNLILLFVAGVGCTTVAFLGWHLLHPVTSLRALFRVMGWRRRGLLGIGVTCLILFGVGLWSVVHSAPGREETVVEVVKEIVDDDSETLTLVETLKAEWDAYDHASWPVAEVMAEASRIAYLPPFKAEPEFIKLGFESVETMSDGSTVGYVVAVDDVAVVVFRGTDDPGDWLANFDRSVAKTPDGPAFRGFYAALSGLSPQVSELISKSEAKSVWITGHSLGGALAVLCAYELARDGDVEVSGLMTFGQPMVARPALTDRIDELLPSRFVHFANNSDIVPRVAPSFSHCGSLVYYDGDVVRRSKPKMLMAAAMNEKELLGDADDFELEPLSTEEFNEMKQELKMERADPDFAPDGTPLLKGSSPLITDHDIELYIERIRSSQ